MYTFTKDDLRKTRYYQDVRQEAREELAEEVRESVKQEVRESVKQEVRESVKQETSKEEALKLVQRLIQRRLGSIAPEFDRQVSQLETIQLENLAVALLDIQNSTDLVNWLENPTISEV